MACWVKDTATLHPSQRSTRQDQRAWSLSRGQCLSAPAQHWAGQNITARAPWGSPQLSDWPDPHDGRARPTPLTLRQGRACPPALRTSPGAQHERGAEMFLGKLLVPGTRPGLQDPDTSLSPQPRSQAGRGPGRGQCSTAEVPPSPTLYLPPGRHGTCPPLPFGAITTLALPLPPCILTSRSARLPGTGPAQGNGREQGRGFLLREFSPCSVAGITSQSPVTSDPKQPLLTHPDPQAPDPSLPPAGYPSPSQSLFSPPAEAGTGSVPQMEGAGAWAEPSRQVLGGPGGSARGEIGRAHV